MSKKFSNNYKKLNKGQLSHYNEILNNLEDKNKPQIFFINGSGGSGKTFLYNTILAKIRSKNEIAVAMASTGIASILLDGGNTAHSTLKLPLNVNSTAICDINSNSNLAELIKKTKMFIWDEAPSMSSDVYETVDRIFRDITRIKNHLEVIYLITIDILKNTLFLKVHYMKIAFII